MHSKGYSLAIVLTAFWMFSVPQDARAQPALAGTFWRSDNFLVDGQCNLTAAIMFYADGTAKVGGILDAYDDGTWALNGNDLTITYRDSHKTAEKWSGTYARGKLRLFHSWPNHDGSTGGETCIFSEDSDKDTDN
jgi:hypothetical protein